MTARVVVIGFGSPIRGDDAFGPLVADCLSEQCVSPHVEIFSRHVLTAELAESLRGATLAIFVDASLDGPVGKLIHRELQPDATRVGTMAHSIDAGGLLAWTRGLYGRAPAAILLSTRGLSFDYSYCRLSPALQQLVAPAAQRVIDLAREHLLAPGAHGVES